MKVLCRVRHLLSISCLLATISLGSVFAQTTHNVPADFPAIQTAVANAAAGDTGLVAPGTYVENIDFLGKAITLQRSGGSDVTTIDGSGCTTGSTSCSVVTCTSGEGAATVLDGLTITGGGPGTLDGQWRGGGMFNHGSSPTVTNLHVHWELPLGRWRRNVQSVQ